MSEYREDDKVPPSDEFEDAFMHDGGVHRVCEGCGRVHYASSAGYDFEEGEREDLDARRAKDPDRCIDHGDESVGSVYLQGMQFVVGCRCNRLRRYEDFIWDNRRDIASYLKRRSEKQMRAAERDAEIAKQVADSAKRPPTGEE